MKPRPATVLPKEAIAELIKATRTPVTRADPLARQRAIEKATQRIKTRYPHLFQKGPES